MRTYTVNAELFDNYWTVALSSAYGTLTEIALYGILLTLLAIAAFLFTNRAQAGRRWLAAATCTMAVFATLQLAVEIAFSILTFHSLQNAVHGEVFPISAKEVRVAHLFNNLTTVYDALLVTNNLVTNSLFIYRCYVVWGRKFRIVIVPILSLLATAIVGYLSTYEDAHPGTIHIDFRVAFGMDLCVNVMLIALTAGRIWWIRRGVSAHLESSFVRRYDTVIAIILESGSIYCLSILLYVVSVSILGSASFSPAITVFRAAMPQIMNIAPVLIIVRAGLGSTIGDTTKTTSPSNPITFKAAQPQNPSSSHATETTQSFMIELDTVRQKDEV